MTMRVLGTLLVACVILLAGCVPGYAGTPTKADNEIKLEKTIGGFSAHGRFGAETDADINLEIEKKNADGSATTVKIPKFITKQSPARTIESWSDPMRVYDQQLATSWRGMTEHTTALMAGVSDVVGQFAPVLTQYLASKAQRPRMVNELSSLMTNPNVNVAGIRDQIPEDIYQEALRKATAEIARLKAQTSQPTVSGGS